MNTRTILIIIAAILVLLLVGLLAFSGGTSETEKNQPATTTNATNSQAVGNMPAPAPSAAATAPAPAAAGMTVTYGPNGFSPANITVPTGTTVTWVNSTSGRMWVGVDEHPTHTNYDGTSTAEHCANGTATSASVFDQCSAGARYSFTFTKAGAFDYHNHANSSHGGTVTVTR